MYISAQLYKVAKLIEPVESKSCYHCVGYYDYLVFEKKDSFGELYKSSSTNDIEKKASVTQKQVLHFYSDVGNGKPNKELFLNEENYGKYHYLITELKLAGKISSEAELQKRWGEIETNLIELQKKNNNELQEEEKKLEGFNFGLFYSLGYSDFVLCLEAQSINALYHVISSIRKMEREGEGENLIQTSFSTLISPMKGLSS
jgi:hypothetical protein